MTVRRSVCVAAMIGAALAANALVALAGREYKSGIIWPEPKMVTPGTNGGPPSDAVVLFDGTNLDQWQNGDKWVIADGVATAKGSGITTKMPYGSCQFHIEFATPAEVNPNQTGQGRGNSGVYFMGKYEVQILDSWENPTYFDGQAAAIYKQTPPMVNASRKPGEWQSYDIIFDAPKFDADGKVTKPAYLTVLHNGVVVQNHFELIGSTNYDKPAAYVAHKDREPIHIQFHGNPVKFRNIWLREITPIVGKKPEPK